MVYTCCTSDDEYALSLTECVCKSQLSIRCSVSCYTFQCWQSDVVQDASNKTLSWSSCCERWVECFWSALGTRYGMCSCLEACLMQNGWHCWHAGEFKYMLGICGASRFDPNQMIPIWFKNDGLIRNFQINRTCRRTTNYAYWSTKNFNRCAVVIEIYFMFMILCL